MGRGRQKAKQTKVARELKYHSSSIDVNALQRELTGGAVYQPPPTPVVDDDDDDDPYASYSKFVEEDDDEPVTGRAAVVGTWLGEAEHPGAPTVDPPGTFDAIYRTVAVDGDVIMGHACTLMPTAR